MNIAQLGDLVVLCRSGESALSKTPPEDRVGELTQLVFIAIDGSAWRRPQNTNADAARLGARATKSDERRNHKVVVYGIWAAVWKRDSSHISISSRNTMAEPTSGNPITTQMPHSDAKKPRMHGASIPPAMAKENRPL